MKSFIPVLSAIALGCVSLNAQVTEQTTDVSTNADGSVTKTQTTTTFNPEYQTKVVKYFDAYKTNPYGLPPEWVTQMKVKEIPAGWRTSRVAPGVVFREEERAHLVAAPAELISVLPTAATGVSYYVAGSNVVAVDSSYRVVDSIQIPSVKFIVD